MVYQPLLILSQWNKQKIYHEKASMSLQELIEAQIQGAYRLDSCFSMESGRACQQGNKFMVQKALIYKKWGKVPKSQSSIFRKRQR
ncbi:hypothetical protein FGO68_gene14503 [Halteria grandinella]|uniref:Uncharacterized protein n=1 Tax=Halteria grandinella TaxID=5974 RepID=A0A8J8P0Y5_HALGN|nr:hypothetical protein FGO68_gene14503 [Halteria grandinella]